jgi:hypothetical protein
MLLQKDTGAVSGLICRPSNTDVLRVATCGYNSTTMTSNKLRITEVQYSAIIIPSPHGHKTDVSQYHDPGFNLPELKASVDEIRNGTSVEENTQKLLEAFDILVLSQIRALMVCGESLVS